MSERYQKIHIIDSHTGGEPTRMVYAGFPDLGTGSMAERLDVLKNQYDHYRRGVILEPRGNDVLVGALLCEPVNPQAAGGVNPVHARERFAGVGCFPWNVATQRKHVSVFAIAETG